MNVVLPSPILDHVRSIFSYVNARVSQSLSIQPNIHEPVLDQILVGALAELGGSRVIDAGGRWVVTLRADVIEGYPLQERWEVADIAFLLILRYRDRIVKVKQGLLQAKRLFAREDSGGDNHPITAMDKVRHFLDTEPPDLTEVSRSFSFTTISRYESLKKDEQYVTIRSFVKRSKIPVFYLFYNPWRLPLRAHVPLTSPMKRRGNPSCGLRVMPSRIVLGVVRTKDTPSFSDLNRAFSSKKRKEPTMKLGDSLGGWRLEMWVADLLMGCHVGYKADSLDDDEIVARFYGRTRPISAVVALTVDIPRSAG